MTMEIVSVELFSRDELLSKIRRTPLMGYGGARPYAHCNVELCPARDPETLVPAQRYVLTAGVRRLLDLRNALLDHEVDIFALDGGARIRTSDDPTTVLPVIPPIVEMSLNREDRRVPLINDGIHRVFAARTMGLPISIVLLSDVPPEYPYYALPLIDGWSDVAELEELPDGFQKKEYWNPQNYKALFRDFNSVFPGVQEQRKRSNPEHLKA